MRKRRGGKGTHTLKVREEERNGVKRKHYIIILHHIHIIVI